MAEIARVSESSLLRTRYVGVGGTYVVPGYCRLDNTMTRDEFYRLPRLDSYFPLDCGAKFDKITLGCSICGASIDSIDVRGHAYPVRESLGYREAGPVVAYKLDADALCSICNRLNQCRFTLHSDFLVTDDLDGSVLHTAYVGVWGRMYEGVVKLRTRITKFFSRGV